MAVIGIDLGTSNSLVGYWDGTDPVLIANEFNKVLTPSVVGVDDNGEILIGEVAKERLISHPQLTAATFKRFMGTEKTYRLGKHEFTPIELSSLVLKKLKQVAEKELGKTCDDAVISVPAYFNNTQREATITAGKLAGFMNLNLISEPTAAALSFGLHKNEEDSLILVVDLGGGTFDVSLLQMFDGIMQVEAIAGDNYLGGEDFTHVIMQDCLKENDLQETILSVEEQRNLYRKAELLKQQVTSNEGKKIEFAVGEKSYTYGLDMDRFEKISEQLLLKMRAPIIRVLNDANYQITDVDQVLLIGGATKADIVRRYVSRLLGQIPFTQVNPDEAVGLGATIQSELKENKEMLEEMILTDVCAHTLGVDVSEKVGKEYRSGIFSPIIERNTTIPVSKVETYYTMYDGQKRIEFNIYQGENRLCKDNLKIGSLTIEFAPVKEDYPVDVRFTYDTDGLLEVITTVRETGISKRLVIEDSPGKLNQAEVDARFEKLSNLKIHPFERAEVRLLMARADRIYAESIGENRNYIQYEISQFEAKLATQDEQVVKKATAEFQVLLNKWEENLWL